MLYLSTTAGIPVGSEVVYLDPGLNSRVTHFCRDKVTHVTKSGQVTTEKGYKFYINGQEMKTATRRYPCYRLCNPEKVAEIQAREEARRQVDKTMHECLKAIQGRQNAFGSYCRITPEILEAAQALTALLTVKN